MVLPSGPHDHPNLQSTLFIRSCLEHHKLCSEVQRRHQAEQVLGHAWTGSMHALAVRQVLHWTD